MYQQREFKHKELKSQAGLRFYTEKGISTFTTNPNAFNLAVEEANEWGFECLNIKVCELEYSNNETIDIDFSKIKDLSRLKKISLSFYSYTLINFNFEPYKEALSQMVNVEILSIGCIKNANELKPYFPKLKRISYVPYNKKPRLTDIEKGWPELEELHMWKYKGDLSLLGRHMNLKRLAIIGLNPDSLEPLANFPNLEGLEIDGMRKSLDISVLSKLPKLKLLLLSGSALQQGWDEVKLGDDVLFIQANRLPSMKVMENNPHVQSFISQEVGELKQKDLKALGWFDRGVGVECIKEPGVLYPLSMPWHDAPFVGKLKRLSDFE